VKQDQTLRVVEPPPLPDFPDNKALGDGWDSPPVTENQGAASGVVPPRRRRGTYVNTVRSAGKLRHYFRPPVGTIIPQHVDTTLPSDPVEADRRARELAAMCVPGGIAPTEIMLQERIDNVLRDGVISCRKRAKLKGIPFLITADMALDLIRAQGYRCAVSGLEFQADAGAETDSWRGPYRPSLDRIKPRLGYVPGNVRVVLVAVNIAMGEWGEDFLVKIAKAVVKHSRRQSER